MIIKNLLITISCLFILSSCGSTGVKKPSNYRSEVLEQVSASSAEAINVELGVGYLKRGQKGDIDIAFGKFKKSILINPKYALAHSLLANVYDQKGFFNDAEYHYKLSMKYNNGNTNIINNYANFLCQRGSYDLAVEKYQDIATNPQYETPSAAYENAGVCSYKANNIIQADNFFRKALAINNRQANSLYYLMLINIKNKKYMKSRAFLQRLEQVVLPSPEMLASGYEIEKSLGNNELAKKYLITLQTKYPRSESLKNIK